LPTSPFWLPYQQDRTFSHQNRYRRLPAPRQQDKSGLPRLESYCRFIQLPRRLIRTHTTGWRRIIHHGDWLSRLAAALHTSPPSPSRSAITSHRYRYSP
jgi:hypothetical protein